MTTTHPLSLADCELTPLEPPSCRACLNHITRGDQPVPSHEGLQWLLAYCDDGVVWGCRDAGQWRLATDEFPGVVPMLGEENLKQLRLFGPQRELLFWRTDDKFLGREVTDLPTPLPDNDPLRRQEEEYLVLGDRVLESQTAKGVGGSRFTLIGDRRGARHAVPWRVKPDDYGSDLQRHWPLRLLVRHYFTCDENGLIRVAASRLVELKFA